MMLSHAGERNAHQQSKTPSQDRTIHTGNKAIGEICSESSVARAEEAANAEVTEGGRVQTGQGD
jgi:hypothetical protein